MYTAAVLEGGVGGGGGGGGSGIGGGSVSTMPPSNGSTMPVTTQSCVTPLSPEERLDTDQIHSHEKGPSYDQDAQHGYIAWNGYVPTHDGTQHGAPFSGSGPTIGWGVDLGALGTSDLHNYGVPQAIIDILATHWTGPHGGPKGQDAVDRLAQYPLDGSIITHAQVQTLTDDVLNGIYGVVVDNFNAQVTQKSFGGRSFPIYRFDQLPQGVQTAITDLAFNSGPYFLSRSPGDPTRQIWEDFVEGHFNTAANELAALPGDRFQDDADDIRQEIANGTAPADATNGVCT